MNRRQPIIIAVFGLFFCAASMANELTLEQAIQLAIDNDPWLQGNEYRQQALEYRSVAAAQLPDPQLSVGMVNLPTDTFAFDQEPMTQLKIGVSQQLPRGKTRELRRQQLEQHSEQTVFQRQDRKAVVRLTVTQLWLEWLRQRKTIELIEQNRNLFADLAGIANANYASALGKTQQYDIIQAQVELTRLQDRLYRLSAAAEVQQARLDEWLPEPVHSLDTLDLPDITVNTAFPINADSVTAPSVLTGYFLKHPKLLQLDQRIAVSETATQLARQQYKPQWGFNTSYAWRDDDPMGNERADFLSVGVTLDLPLFTNNRQDKEVGAAIAQAEAIKTEKAQLLRAFMAQANQARAKLERLEQRQQLYQTRLLKEIDEQVEASMTAYTNDNADFNQVVRARISGLNSRIDALSIDIDRLQTIAQLNYLFTGARP